MPLGEDLLVDAQACVRASALLESVVGQRFSGLQPDDGLWHHAQVVKMGRSISHVRVDFYRRRTGQLVAQGKHTEFIPDAAESIPPVPPAKL